MKKCSICKQTKSRIDFNKKTSRKDGLQPHCRECSKIRFKAYYNSNKEKHYKQVKENSRRYTNRNREYVYQYLLKHPCIDCGEANPMRLQFDHTRDKLDDVTRLTSSGYALQKLKLEIDKCEVRCANCHQEKTAKDFDWWIYKRHNGSLAK